MLIKSLQNPVVFPSVRNNRYGFWKYKLTQQYYGKGSNQQIGSAFTLWYPDSKSTYIYITLKKVFKALSI
jgi:hypothetical protein